MAIDPYAGVKVLGTLWRTNPKDRIYVRRLPSLFEACPAEQTEVTAAFSAFLKGREVVVEWEEGAEALNREGATEGTARHNV